MVMQNSTKNTNKTTRKQVSIHTASVMVIAFLQLSLQGGPLFASTKLLRQVLRGFMWFLQQFLQGFKTDAGLGHRVGGHAASSPICRHKARSSFLHPASSNLCYFLPSFLPGARAKSKKGRKEEKEETNAPSSLSFDSPYSLHDISPASSPPPMHHLPDTSLKVSLRSGQEAFQGLAMTVVGAVGDVWV